MNEMLQGVKTLHKIWAKTFEATIQLGETKTFIDVFLILY